jgi:hypothetical protein
MVKTFTVPFPDGRIETLTIPQYVASVVVSKYEVHDHEDIAKAMPSVAWELIEAGAFTLEEYNLAVAREQPVSCPQCGAPVTESADLCPRCGSYLFGDHHA